MSRASSPAIAAFILVGVTVSLSAVVGAVAMGLPGPAPAPAVAVSVEATADDQRIVVVHEAGPTLDVGAVELRITIDGTPLAEQPPVPFFSARGFRAGPTGPFNVATHPGWDTGERASLRLAATNSPLLRPGVAVTVELRRDGLPVASARTRAQ